MDMIRGGNEPIAHKATHGSAQRTALLLAIALAFSIALIACGRPLPTPTPTATPPPTGTAVPTRIPPPPTVTSTVVPTPTLVPIDERPILEALYLSTDGGNWTRNDNWLTDAPLESGMALPPTTWGASLLYSWQKMN